MSFPIYPSSCPHIQTEANPMNREVSLRQIETDMFGVFENLHLDNQQAILRLFNDVYVYEKASPQTSIMSILQDVLNAQKMGIEIVEMLACKLPNEAITFFTNGKYKPHPNKLFAVTYLDLSFNNRINIQSLQLDMEVIFKDLNGNKENLLDLFNLILKYETENPATSFFPILENMTIRQKIDRNSLQFLVDKLSDQALVFFTKGKYNPHANKAGALIYLNMALNGKSAFKPSPLPSSIQESIHQVSASISKPNTSSLSTHTFTSTVSEGSEGEANSNLLRPTGAPPSSPVPQLIPNSVLAAEGEGREKENEASFTRLANDIHKVFTNLNTTSVDQIISLFKNIYQYENSPHNVSLMAFLEENLNKESLNISILSVLGNGLTKNELEFFSRVSQQSNLQRISAISHSNFALTYPATFSSAAAPASYASHATPASYASHATPVTYEYYPLPPPMSAMAPGYSSLVESAVEPTQNHPTTFSSAAALASYASHATPVLPPQLMSPTPPASYYFYPESVAGPQNHPHSYSYLSAAAPTSSSQMSQVAVSALMGLSSLPPKKKSKRNEGEGSEGEGGEEETQSEQKINDASDQNVKFDPPNQIGKRKIALLEMYTSKNQAILSSNAELEKFNVEIDKFINLFKSKVSSDYLNKNEFRSAMGKVFRIHIIKQPTDSEEEKKLKEKTIDKINTLFKLLLGNGKHEKFKKYVTQYLGNNIFSGLANQTVPLLNSELQPILRDTLASTNLNCDSWRNMTKLFATLSNSGLSEDTLISFFKNVYEHASNKTYKRNVELYPKADALFTQKYNKKNANTNERVKTSLLKLLNRELKLVLKLIPSLNLYFTSDELQKIGKGEYLSLPNGGEGNS